MPFADMHRQAPLSALSAIDEVQHDPSARCPVTLMPGESLSPSVHGANTSIVVLMIDRVVVGVIDEDAVAEFGAPFAKRWPAHGKRPRLPLPRRREQL